MSRTKKGGKPQGYEFWSARPGNKHGGGRGAYSKTKTHRVERQQGKEEIRGELRVVD